MPRNTPLTLVAGRLAAFSSEEKAILDGVGHTSLNQVLVLVASRGPLAVSEMARIVGESENDIRVCCYRHEELFVQQSLGGAQAPLLALNPHHLEVSREVEWFPFGKIQHQRTPAQLVRSIIKASRLRTRPEVEIVRQFGALFCEVYLQIHDDWQNKYTPDAGHYWFFKGVNSVTTGFASSAKKPLRKLLGKLVMGRMSRMPEENAEKVRAFLIRRMRLASPCGFVACEYGGEGATAGASLLHALADEVEKRSSFSWSRYEIYSFLCAQLGQPDARPGPSP